MASEISEGLSCPICFEIPEAEVYQCENEHWLCSKCFFQINPPLCPECRTELDRDHPRRCRAIERVLEGVKIECTFKPKGCEKKLSRGLAQGHQAECIFNFDKFGQFVNLCKKIGYAKCDFKFNNGNVKEAVEHFVSEHGCILTTSEQFQMELRSFKESAKAEGRGPQFQFWTPIIAYLKARKRYLLTMVILNKVDASFTWVSIFLSYPTKKDRETSPVEMEYSVETRDAFPVSVWIGRPMSLKLAHKMLPDRIAFVNYSLPFIQACSEEGSLSIDCKIRRHGVAAPAPGENLQRFICKSNAISFSVAKSNVALR